MDRILASCVFQSVPRDQPSCCARAVINPFKGCTDCCDVMRGELPWAWQGAGKDKNGEVILKGLT